MQMLRRSSLDYEEAARWALHAVLARPCSQVRALQTRQRHERMNRPPRTRVPHLGDCLAVIDREARYWLPRFRRHALLDDLRQEGAIAALRALLYFDPTRGVKVETWVTGAIRKHLRRHIRVVLNDALDYTATQREGAKAYEHERGGIARHSVETRVLLARVRALPDAQRALALDLLREDGIIAHVARSNDWTLSQTKQRVERLRATLRR